MRRWGIKINQIASPIFTLLLFTLSDTLGRKRTLYIAWILISVGSLLTYFVDSYLWKMLFYGIANGSESVFSTIALMVMNEITSK